MRISGSQLSYMSTVANILRVTLIDEAMKKEYLDGRCNFTISRMFILLSPVFLSVCSKSVTFYECVSVSVCVCVYGPTERSLSSCLFIWKYHLKWSSDSLKSAYYNVHNLHNFNCVSYQRGFRLLRHTVQNNGWIGGHEYFKKRWET